MKKNKSNIFLLLTSVLSMIMLIIGAAYSYFSMEARSELDALAVEAGKIKLGLSVSPKYTGYNIIPTNDSDIMTAYNQKCIDNVGYGACLAYTLKVSNFSLKQDVIGNINFTIEGINNLSYLVLDENDQIYLSKTSIGSGGTEMSLGPVFNLAEGTEKLPTYKEFTLLVWLTNLDEDQSEYDSEGTFTATVTYKTSNDSKLTATIEGKKEDGQEIAKID